MIGDQSDVLTRLKSVIPPWFGTLTPNMDTLLTGPATVFSAIYSFIQYAQLQTRIQTSTDGWLDLTARDFFGRGFPRRVNEPDASYVARILKEILRPRVTRTALSNALLDLTGIAPIIFEPARVADTGALGILAPPSFAIGGGALPNTGITADSAIITADSTLITGNASAISAQGIGAWGSLNYRNQFFVTAYRPPSVGIPNVAGLTSLINPTGLGALGGGAIALSNLANINGSVTDAEIYATIARNIAAGVTAWTRITAFSGLTPANLTAWLPASTDQTDIPMPTDSGDPSTFLVEAAPF